MEREYGVAQAGTRTVSVQDEGRKILAAMYAALRALKFYPLENEAVQAALRDLHVAVTGFIAREGVLTIRVVGDFFFLNDQRLRLDLRTFSTFGSFARSLRDHKVGEVMVERGIKIDEWAPFLSLILRAPDGDEPYEKFLERLAGTKVESIEVKAEREAQQINLESEAMEGARRTYATSVQTARDVLSDVRMGKAVNVRKVKRMVQGIVDQVLSDEPSLMAMTNLREFDEYTFTHSVNVCIFAVVIGQRIGLEKAHLYELGLAALFHDVGKMRLPPEVLNKTGPLEPHEWELLKEHPANGLLVLFQLHGFLDVPYRQMLVAYEHHMKTDRSGYPEVRRPRSVGLFSKIVAVADGFDAGSSVRSYQYKPQAPDQVLKEMRDNPERGFDPVIVKALMTATGVYPVGTLVILDTFELGVVTKANTDPARLHQPEVKLIADPMGTPLATPVAVRLDELNPATGTPLRSIIKTTDPQKYGIQVAEYVA